ncbi:MAG: archaeal proteasome endopeptidase complex subunit alpha [Haloferacaceae archaeon]
MRGNDQQAYDRGTSLFSPDGRIYQVEYAREAVSRGAPSVGVRTSEGIVLAALAQPSSTLMEAESIEKLHKLDDHLGTTNAGHVADARKLIDYARRFAQGNRLRYGEPVGVETLTKHVTDFIQENTQRGGTRPFGAALLVGGIEDGEPRLFSADPSGTPHEWRATVIGADRKEIQSLLEDEYEEDLDLEGGIELAVRGLRVHSEDLEAEHVNLATISAEDGYESCSPEDVRSVLDRVLDGAEEEGEEAEDADGDEEAD